MARARRRAKRGNGCGSVYQRNGRGPFIAAWTGHDGKPRVKSTRTTDRQAAMDILSKWTGDAARRREGVIDPAIERLTIEGKRPIGEHLTDWRAFMASKGNAAKHVAQYARAATETLAAAKAGTLAAITPSGIIDAVAGLCGGKASNRTKNHSLGAVRAFCRWCVRERRLSLNPLAGVSEWNLATDRRRVRRALDGDELARIIAAAEHGPRFKAMDGPDRAMLYRLAAGTGFRASELGSLTLESFRLDDDQPTIIVAAGASKRRREDRQPIRADLAEALRSWLSDKPKGAPVFPARMDKAAAMLRFDLRRAWRHWTRETPPGAQRRERRRTAFLRETDDAGRVADFHALRASYITEIVKGGASVKVSQTLARHSTPVLTMNTYARLGVHDLTGALDALPSLGGGSEREAAALKATGTDGAHSDTHSNRDSNRPAQHRASSRDSALTIAHGRADDEQKDIGKQAVSTHHRALVQRHASKPPGRLELPTCRLQISRSAD